MEVAIEPPVFIDRGTTEMRVPQCGDWVPHVMLRFNERLSSLAGRLMNESDMMRLIKDLGAIPGRHTAIHALILARITELALFCAGNYADGCEFEAVGDLLVNPRRVDIHVREKINPIQKKRHGRISEQLAGLIGKDDPIDWLKGNTWLNLREQAVLPALYEELEISGFIVSDYLQSIAHRMCQISDTMAFLSAWQIDNALDLHKKLKESSAEEGAFVADNLCRFDLSVFYEIGNGIGGMGRGKTTCRFLKKDILTEDGL